MLRAHPLPSLVLAGLLSLSPSASALEPAPHFLDNGRIRLGVDKSSGASLFHFSLSGSQRNLLNHADRGRFLQQSYYGVPDDSTWNGKPWRWNPVQGGNWKGAPAKLEAFEPGPDRLYARTIPHHWAADHLIPEARMEEWIILRGEIAELRFRFHYNGEKSHPAHHQELPAVFMDHALPHLVFYDGEAPWTGAPLTRVTPGWPNELQKSTENWAAYLDDHDWGCGLYFPGTTLLTTYRHPGPAGPRGTGCSYFAPLRTMAITPGLRFDYTVYLTIGSVQEIRARFAALRAAPPGKRAGRKGESAPSPVP